MGSKNQRSAHLCSAFIGLSCLIHEVIMHFSLHYEDTGGGLGMEKNKERRSRKLL